MPSHSPKRVESQTLVDNWSLAGRTNLLPRTPPVLEQLSNRDSSANHSGIANHSPDHVTPQLYADQSASEEQIACVEVTGASLLTLIVNKPFVERFSMSMRKTGIVVVNGLEFCHLRHHVKLMVDEPLSWRSLI